MLDIYNNLSRLQVLYVLDDVVKKEVKRKKFTADIVADNININRNTFKSYFRNGGVKMPYKTFSSVCKYLELDEKELIAKAEKKLF